jgi:bacterial/archaeal transporter family-2 protein
MPYLAFAFAIGVMIPMQAAINSQLKSYVGGSTVLAAFVSFAVGTLALAAVATAMGQRWSALGDLPKADGWHLTGGLLGALFVFGTTLLAPKIGVAKMTALIVAGQVLVSLVMDHNGWLGLAVREITPSRIVGAALVVVGVFLVNLDQLLGR